MKTLSFFALALVAAVTAFFVFPFSVEITGSVLFGAALAGLVLSEYAQPRPSLYDCTLSGRPLPTAKRAERFGLAA